MVSARKMIYPQLSQREEKIPKKTRYFDPKTCSQCIVAVAPYPSSLGGVYQPVKAEREIPLQNHPYHCVSIEPQPSRKIYSPFFSCICTRDLYDCCALARLYWF